MDITKGCSLESGFLKGGIDGSLVVFEYQCWVIAKLSQILQGLEYVLLVSISLARGRLRTNHVFG